MLMKSLTGKGTQSSIPYILTGSNAALVLWRQTSKPIKISTPIFIKFPSCPEKNTEIMNAESLAWFSQSTERKMGVCHGVWPASIWVFQWRFPTKLQKHVRYPPCLSWAASRVLTLRCLNLHSAGVQIQNTLVTHLPAVSPDSPTKQKKKTNQIKCYSIYMPTNLVAKINLYMNYNVLITNTFVQPPIFFFFLCVQLSWEINLG